MNLNDKAVSRPDTVVVSSGFSATSRNVSLLASPVVPGSVAVKLGRLNSGNLASLAQGDLVYYEVCKFFVPNQQSAPINVEVESTNPVNTLSALGFRVLGKVTTSGSLLRKLEMWDWQASRWDPVDVLTGPLSTTLVEHVVNDTGNISRYMNGSKRMKSRWTVKAVGPVGSSSWCKDTDQAVFLVQP